MKDNQLFDLMCKTLYTAVISDALDDLGYRNQVMREDIVPLNAEWIIAGRAKTILAVDIHYVREDHYGKEIESVDSIKPGEIVIGATNQSRQNGMWGELLSTASKARGANGAIIDGLIRDSSKILKMDFPVFSTGTKPVDSKGRGIAIDYDCPVVCGDVLVQSNDVIFADRDGIVVIPKDIIEQVIEIATNKVTSENSTRSELVAGTYLRDVFAKYGVL